MRTTIMQTKIDGFMDFENKNEADMAHKPQAYIGCDARSLNKINIGAETGSRRIVSNGLVGSPKVRVIFCWVNFLISYAK